MKTYEDSARALESLIEFNPNKKGLEPKSLYVGVKMSKADMKGLAELLISKGVFTAEEYVAAVTESAVEEVELYRRVLAEALGSILPDITLAGSRQ